MAFKTFIKKLTNFLKLALCEKGVPSSKRLVAMLVILCVLFCTCWSVANYGMTENNKTIIEYQIILVGALLGITSITSIWKK